MEQLFNVNNPYEAKILGEPTLRPEALAKSMQFQLPGPSEQSANELSGNQYADVTSENVDKGGLASLKEIFTEMAYNIESIARNTLDTANFLEKMAPSARDKAVDDADKKKVPPGSDNDSQGNESKFGLEVPRVGTKTGLALMLLSLGALFKYGDEIAAGIATVLPYVKKFTDMLGPQGTLYLGLAGLAALIFPKTFETLLGVGTKSISFAFDLLKGGFTLMRTFVMTTAPNALLAAYGGAKGLVIKAFTALKAAFTAMRVFILKTLIPAIASSYGGAKGLLMKAVGGLALAFTALKVFLLGTLIPAITAIAAPFIVPIAMVAAVVAGAVAVFYSIKAGIDEFKKSLEEGDSMLVAIIEGVSTALLTLVTLPITLIKNFVAWVAEKLGFEGIAEKLKEINIVDSIKNGIKNIVMKAVDFVTGLFDIDFNEVLGKFVDIGSAIGRVLKGIALGSIAAVKAAFPGGESPMEAFKRVYDEVSNKGNENPTLSDEADIGTDTVDADMVVASEIKPEIAKKALELQETNSAGTVITTVNNTDASNTNNTSNTTTNAPGLAVTGTDSTAKALSYAGYGEVF